jgi:ABC-2 type transport system permease protein
VLALEGATFRDFSLAEMLFPCGVLLGVGALGFGCGVFVFSRAES